MRQGNVRQPNSPDRWSPKLFLLAGVLLLGYAALNGIAAFTDTSYVTVEDVVGPGGFVLGFLGALGLYRSLTERSPRLARTGVCCVSLGAVGFSVITLQGLAVIAGLGSGGTHGILLILVTIGMIPGYLSFAVASLRADVYARGVGLLLFVPAVVYAAMLSQALLFVQFGRFSQPTMAWSAFAISSTQAAAHLSIWYTLRGGVSPDEGASRSTDVTVS